MNKLAGRVTKLMTAYVRTIAMGLIVLMALNVVNVVRQHTASGKPGTNAAANNGGLINNAGGAQQGSTPGQIATPGSLKPGSKAAKSKQLAAAAPGTYIPGVGTAPLGIHGNKVHLVYYWAGDRTGSSAYLGKAGQAGAVDEADAFRRFIAYINKHRNGGATFMGFPFNLHGRTIDYDILDVGKYPQDYEQAAIKIAKEIKPFAAISSHGGVSSYICPTLAKAHIFNPVTYNLNWGLTKQTGGWCLPQGIAFERQVQLTISYLKKQAKTPYTNAAGQAVPRVYGILYADYPGLGDAVKRLKNEMLAAGIPLNPNSVYSVPTGLTDAAQAQPGVVAKFVADGVNTIIDPDSGAPITFTHAAQANAYSPDYYVWPCSGEDAAGQVRLYDPHQWSRAKGLSCYDDTWGLDLTLDGNARASQWFHQYREMSNSSDDPPATSPLVYEGILPVLIGLTNAGHDVTVENFFAGLNRFRGYRYDGINGPTSDPSHFIVSGGQHDGSQIGDVAEVTWDNSRTTSGNATAGAYIYSKKRYAAGAKF